MKYDIVFNHDEFNNIRIGIGGLKFLFRYISCEKIRFIRRFNSIYPVDEGGMVITYPDLLLDDILRRKLILCLKEMKNSVDMFRGIREFVAETLIELERIEEEFTA